MVAAAMRGKGVARRAHAESTDDVAASDLRWLVVVALVFAAALVVFFAALFVYHALGGHPGVWAVIPRLRRVAPRVVPPLSPPRRGAGPGRAPRPPPARGPTRRP